MGWPVAIRGQCADGFYDGGAALAAVYTCRSGPRSAGSGLSPSGAVVGARSILSGELSGLDECGPLARCEFPRNAHGNGITISVWTWRLAFSKSFASGVVNTRDKSRKRSQLVYETILEIRQKG